MRGGLPRPGDRTVAVVGSRSVSAVESGIEQARSVGAALAGRGAWVISGGAVGIDAAAHSGAVEAGGRTVVVLGGGLDHLYPAENRGLFARVVETGGGLVAEVDDDQRPARWSFPKRNRIVAALGEATVVVRAGARSGALLTAEHAARIGQPIWVAARVDGRRRGGAPQARRRRRGGVPDGGGAGRGARARRRRREGARRPRIPAPGGEAAALWERARPSSRGEPTRWRGGPGSVRVPCWRD